MKIPSSIGAAPYICKVNEFRFYSSKEFFDLEYEFEVQVLPPLSAYVGSDILMGIYILFKREGVVDGSRDEWRNGI